MNPKEYTGKEWDAFLRELTPRQLKNSVKRAYRREAKKACKIAVGKLRTSSLKVKGDRSDWEKGIRSYIYSRGSGFMVTVKARGASRSGKGEKGMHANRAGKKKPILMWAEDGTTVRKTKSKTKVFIRKRKGHNTGRMPKYGFLESATSEMFSSVEGGIFPEVEMSVNKAAQKAGLI